METWRQQNWSDLPCDILSNILQKLTIIDDYIPFGAVSISWRTVFLQQNQNPNFHPLLLIPSPTRKHIPCPTRKRKRHDEEREIERCLYNILRKKLYNFQIQIPPKRYCRGSSFGWLITMKCKECKEQGTRKLKYYIRLRNPFLPQQEIIHLPSLPLFGVVEQNGSDDDLSRPFIYLRKAVLSAAPDNNGNKNFVVMAIMSQYCRLAYFNPAEKASFCWTPIGDWNEWTLFVDLIYFNKTKEFYAVNGESGEVFAINFENQLPEFRQVAPFIEKYKVLRRYIVESPEGELLQVLKKEDLITKGRKTISIVVKFEVFKLSPSGGEWIQMLNLENMILFLGTNASISRSASDFPECKANCIYFTNNWDDSFNGTCSVYEAEDAGIYNFDDGTISPYFSNAPFAPLEAIPIWLEPTLQR